MGQDRCPGNSGLRQQVSTETPWEDCRKAQEERVSENTWAKGWNLGSREKAQRTLPITFSQLLALGFPVVTKAFIMISFLVFHLTALGEHLGEWILASAGLSIGHPHRSQGCKSSFKSIQILNSFCWRWLWKSGLSLRATSYHLMVPKSWSKLIFFAPIYILIKHLWMSSYCSRLRACVNCSSLFVWVGRGRAPWNSSPPLPLRLLKPSLIALQS